MNLDRKHRPGLFSELLGPAYGVGDSLRRMVARDEPSQHVLFVGERGTGKTTTARILGMAVSCLSPVDGEPCMKCSACADPRLREVNCGDHTGIDDAREIINSMRYRPLSGRRSVYILDEAHKLSNAAQNALLKPVEEPLDHVCIIICSTEPSKIMPTLSNRLNRYDFRNFSDNEMRMLLYRVLRAEGVEDLNEVIVAAVMEAASGCPRAALTELEKVLHGNQLLPDDEAIAILGSSSGEDAAEVRDLAAALVRGVTWQVLADMLGSVLRSVSAEAIRIGLSSYLRAVLATEIRHAKVVSLASATMRLAEPLLDRRPKVKLTAQLAYAWADLTS